MIDINKTSGLYLFDEFYISMKGNGVLRAIKDFGTWTMEQKFVFLHEYIHYFQNIYTFFGLNLFSLIIDNGKSLRRTIGKEVSVPLKISRHIQRILSITSRNLSGFSAHEITSSGCWPI